MAGVMGMQPATPSTDWAAVTALYATADYIKCGVAVALVEIIARAFGLVPTII